MSFIPVPNCAEVVLQGSFSPGDAIITLGFERAAPFSVTDLNDLLIAIQTWWDENLSEQVTGGWKMPQFKATALDTVSSPSVIRINDGELQGQLGEDGMPDNVAMSVTFLTESRGRSYRGRNFVPGLPLAGLANNSSFALVYAANMSAAYDGLTAILTDSGTQHVVISRYNAGAPRVTGVATPVTDYRANQKVATMRRRIVGTGS